MTDSVKTNEIAGDVAEFARARIERLRAELQRQGLDAMYVRDLSNIAWLTAFQGVFDGEDAHAAFADATRSVVHTDSRYTAAMRIAAGAGPWDVSGQAAPHAVWLHGLVEDGMKLGIETSMSLAEFRRLELELSPEMAVALNFGRAKAAQGGGEGAPDGPAPKWVEPEPVQLCETEGVVAGLRAVKDAYEIACLKAAQAVTDAAFAHILGFIRPGMTERQVQVELEGYMLRNGGSGLAFSSIVATGANGASPHAIPGETVLEAGQCVVMDFGARAHGYCSDMTRMVFLGQPSQRLRTAYQVLRDANEQAAAMIRPGVTGAQANQRAEEVLAAGGFGGLMGHSLGHGVGIDIHEQPTVSMRNDEPLVPGNVITVEPGIYVEGEFGMRLEDCGVVTDDGFQVFTQTPHDMYII